MRVLIFDVETTGLDPEKDRIIEVGYVLWDASFRTMMEVYSSLSFATQDGGEGSQVVNGIPRDLVDQWHMLGDPSIVWAMVADAARRADIVVAHSAEFDRKFVAAFERTYEGRNLHVSEELATLLGKPWVCTIEDFVWPVKCRARNLTELALCHGVGVVASHRSVNDCLTLTRMFESVLDTEERLEQARIKAARPKAEFVSLEPYEKKDVVKAAGFHWDGERRVWHRYLAVEDAERLPFRVSRAP